MPCPNPATAIARLAGALHDERGRVQIPGFYDDVLELTDEERALFAGCPPTTPSSSPWRSHARCRASSGFSTLERIGARPTAEVNGIWGGYQGEGSKTIVPERCAREAVASTGRRPESAKIIAASSSSSPTTRRPASSARSTWEGDGVAPCIVPIGTPGLRALTDAISHAFDGLPVLPTREGGSGPEAALQQMLGAPLVFLGVGLPDDQIHAPNEKVTLSMLYKGAEAAALLWDNFARLGRARLTGARLAQDAIE